MAARPAGDAENFRSDGIEGQHLVSEACGGDGAGHSPDGAGGFVLGEDAAALLANDAAAEGPSEPMPVSTTARTPEP